MQIDVWCKTDKGLRRESNQDSFLVNRDLGLFIVADGMGGHSGGEVASSMAVTVCEEVVRTLRSSGLGPRETVLKIYEESCHRIYDRAAKQDPQLAGMGTTMVMLYCSGPSMFIGNVGDSRAYLFRRPHFWQLTEDHSLLNEQIRAGLIREDQVRQFVGRNVITRSVGYERDVMVDILERPLKSGDCFLLCSDGLSGLVPDVKIAEIINTTPLDQVVDKCVEQALANGGDDNVTVLLLSVT
ncbi:MAG: Stp1/IreP family PP2C-type Ser/Thr phosphatase [Bdellovibrio sp.]|jgi:serine/threonine protein phosphatase PrpC